jgi:hypothetical protein
MRIGVSLIILLLTVICSTPEAFAQSGPCDAALVKSTYRLSNNVGLDWRLAELVDEYTYKEIKRDAGANAVIYGVPVGADYHDFQQNISTLKTQHNESLTYSQRLNVAWTGLDPNAPTVYRDCLNNQIFNTHGLHAAVIGATQSDISILLKWDVPGVLSTTIQWTGVEPSLLHNFPRTKRQGENTIVVRPSTTLADFERHGIPKSVFL